MMRLVRNGLMYGNLFEVATPVMVERYNRALERLIGKRTALQSFHIDLSGYAPEIAEEFGDTKYLNPNGCNRLFILLSVDQMRSPLVEGDFSTSRTILRRFIEENRKPIFALTARDAVFGELENSVWKLRDPEDLLHIRKIRVAADTPRRLLTDANELRQRIRTFRKDEDAWWDDELIGGMIDLAGRVGDIRHEPMQLRRKTFSVGNFHTGHFGGLYVFRDVEQPAVLAMGDERLPEQLGEVSVLRAGDRFGIARFLEDNGLVETLFDAADIDAAAVLRQRLDFILIDHLASTGALAGLDGFDRAALRGMTHRVHDELSTEFHGIAAALRYLDQGGERPQPKADDPAYFYLLRASAHDDRDLVNQLLAELTPLDIRQLFICNKNAFYSFYRDWDDAKRDYVVEFLVNEYLIDKQGVRRELYGAEPSMAEPGLGADTAAYSGPWGTARAGAKGPWGGARAGDSR